MSKLDALFYHFGKASRHFFVNPHAQPLQQHYVVPVNDSRPFKTWVLMPVSCAFLDLTTESIFDAEFGLRRSVKI